MEGKITRLTNFGAFARLVLEDMDGDLEGLIHISEISERRIEHPKEVLHEGDVVTLRIIKIEDETHRIGLSMRRVDSPAYTDLDWKTLTEELDVDEISESASEDETPIEDVVETEETVGETVEAEVAAESEESAEEIAEAEVETVEAEEETVETTEEPEETPESSEEEPEE